MLTSALRYDSPRSRTLLKRIHGKIGYMCSDKANSCRENTQLVKVMGGRPFLMLILVHWPSIHLRYGLSVLVIRPWNVVPPEEFIEGTRPAYAARLFESGNLVTSLTSLTSRRAE